MEIMSGLHSSPVGRLRKTWAEVTKSKVYGPMYKKLGEVTSPEHNYKVRWIAYFPSTLLLLTSPESPRVD